MTDNKKERELLLGRQVPVSDVYAPQLLYPIARSETRRELGLDDSLPFYGMDVWHLYEVSWLGPGGMPRSRVGRLEYSAHSPHIVESKSLKLYLNSLNNTEFEDETAFISVVCEDLEKLLGTRPTLQLYAPDASAIGGQSLPGRLLDGLHCESAPAERPAAELLLPFDGAGAAESGGRAGAGRETCYSHLMRALCPVTGQPDWASIWIDYDGPRFAPTSLLHYILSFRNHREFHEQCVERVFHDINVRFQPRLLTVQGLYTRRGGLDICPMRSSNPEARPLPRTNRQ